jgi:hypothetical protein
VKVGRCRVRRPLFAIEEVDVDSQVPPAAYEKSGARFSYISYCNLSYSFNVQAILLTFFWIEGVTVLGVSGVVFIVQYVALRILALHNDLIGCLS